MTCKMKKPSQMAGQFLCGSSVFFPGSQTAPDVALLFVYIQYLSHLLIEPAIAAGQALLEIFMYGRFGDAKVLGGGPHRGAGLDHVHSQFAGAFFDGI